MAVHEDPLPDGEVDIFEWYGNGSWPAGTTVHAASNGKTWEGKSIPNWSTAGGTPGECGGTGTVSNSGGTTLTVRNRTSVCRRSLYRSPADPTTGGGVDNNPGYWLNPMFTLAVGGPGTGDAALGNFPAAMLIDYVHAFGRRFGRLSRRLDDLN